jgi:HAD superfamily hydrolase (TIGR01458 family)
MKAVFFDLSGVLYEGRQVIPGAVKTINHLLKGNLTLRFITNTARKTKQQILQQLNAMGFEIPDDLLFTAPNAALSYCLEHQLNPYCLVHRNIKQEFKEIEQEPFNAVILGDAEDDLNYTNLNKAFNILLLGGTLITIGENRYFKDEQGYHLDTGPFTRALEYAAHTQAIVTGKPSAEFFRQVIATTAFNPEDILMIGDDVYGDIEGALNLGMKACLVKTGKYRPGDEQHLSPPCEVASDVNAVIHRYFPEL